MYTFLIVSEDCCLLPVPGVFIYEPLNSNEFYPPPQQNDSGYQTCDCNSVMYKYEVQTSRRGSCVDLPFAKSRHGVCFMSGGCGLLVRPRTATSLYCLLTTPSRWPNWIATCKSPDLAEWVPPFRRWRHLMYSGTQATSRKELPSHTGHSTTSQQVIFLPSDNAHVLILDAKWLANQTYDEATMERVGCKFTIEQTSSTLFTGFYYQRILKSYQLKSMSQASPVVPAPRRLPSVRAAPRARLVSQAPPTIPVIIRKVERTSEPSLVVRPGI